MKSGARIFTEYLIFFLSILIVPYKIAEVSNTDLAFVVQIIIVLSGFLYLQQTSE